MSQINNGSDSSGNFKTAMFADCLANSKDIFQLIDEVFPIDSCKHYEVLPLKLVGSNLALGMLDPYNEESLKFVNSLARVFNYSLEIQLIDAQTFQLILDSYPQNTPQARSSGDEVRDRHQTIVDDRFKSNTDSQSDNSRRLSDSAPTVVSQSESTPSSQSPELPDLPPDLDFFKESKATPQSKPRSPQPKKDVAATLFEIPPEFLQKQPRELDDRPTIIGGNPADLLARESSIPDDEIAKAEAQISELLDGISSITNKAQDEQNFLAESLPELSWQKLLEQAFKRQTEQIDLVRHGDRGSIIAIKDKVTQSSIERVPLPIFASLMNEIRRIAKLPQNKLTSPKKIVLERFYEQERILVRLEFIPSQEETVKVQILRSQALKIYEQQQMDRVSEQALQLAKQLEKTLRRIQVCFDSAELNNLKELQAVQSRINHQLRLLDK